MFSTFFRFSSVVCSCYFFYRYSLFTSRIFRCLHSHLCYRVPFRCMRACACGWACLAQALDYEDTNAWLLRCHGWWHQPFRFNFRRCCYCICPCSFNIFFAIFCWNLNICWRFFTTIPNQPTPFQYVSSTSHQYGRERAGKKRKNTKENQKIMRRVCRTERRWIKNAPFIISCITYSSLYFVTVVIVIAVVLELYSKFHFFRICSFFCYLSCVR